VKKSKGEYCPHCGALMVEHKHSLGVGLVESLRRIWECGGGPIKLKELKLTYNQESNFQKLRYWGLVAKADHNNKRGGEWLITPKGDLFLTGKYVVGKHAYSFRGKLTRREAPMVTIHEIDREGIYYVKYSEYLERMNPKGEKIQMELNLGI